MLKSDFVLVCMFICVFVLVFILVLGLYFCYFCFRVARDVPALIKLERVFGRMNENVSLFYVFDVADNNFFENVSSWSVIFFGISGRRFSMSYRKVAMLLMCSC